MALPKVNTARYDMVIPSTGQAVKYRPYLVAEEKILMIAMESGDQRQILNAISDVIEACVDEDIDASALAVFDIENIFLNLREKSVGEGIELMMKCQNEDCKEDTGPHHINLNDIQTPVVAEGENIINISDDVGITLKYPSFDAVSGLDESDLEGIEGVMALVKSSIKTIFTDDEVFEASSHTDEELDEFIGSLNSDQFVKINDFFEGMPTIKYDLKYACEKCSHANEIELRGIQSFFT